MKYYELPESVHFQCSFPIGDEIYSASIRTLSTSKNKIWTVRNQEGVEIFKNLNLVSGVNYAGIFSGFGEDKVLKYFTDGEKSYLGTEKTGLSNNQ